MIVGPPAVSTLTYRYAIRYALVVSLCLACQIVSSRAVGEGVPRCNDEGQGGRAVERRSFLFGLCGLAGVVATGRIIATPAEATPLEALRSIKTPEPESDAADAYGTAPDGTPAEDTYWVWRNGRRVWVAPRRRRRRRVCRRVWGRGGWRTRCWYR